MSDETEGSVDPTREQFKAFMLCPQDTEIQMLNLIRLRDIAAYPEGHPDHGKGLTGLEAYRAYGRTTAPILKGLGGRIVWSGEPKVMLTGPQDEAWDIAFIAEYPSVQAFVDMLRDPVYREAVKHRQAAVKIEAAKQIAGEHGDFDFLETVWITAAFQTHGKEYLATFLLEGLFHFRLSVCTHLQCIPRMEAW